MECIGFTTIFVFFFFNGYVGIDPFIGQTEFSGSYRVIFDRKFVLAGTPRRSFFDSLSSLQKRKDKL